MSKSINLRILFFSTFVALVIFGCSDKKAKDIQEEDPYLKQLTEKQIGDINYFISIPKNYTIKENRGPDFSVYYFYPTDTTAKAAFSGGLYFGNHPSQFEVSSDSCKTEKFKSKILNKNADWTSYNCQGKFSIQTIVESGSGEGWNEYIHAFAGASSTADLKKVLVIFKTIKKKKKKGN
jgi:hypothetical protein